jgi:hypothetical protein
MVTNGRNDKSHGVNPTRTPGSTVPGVTRKGNNSVRIVFFTSNSPHPQRSHLSSRLLNFGKLIEYEPTRIVVETPTEKMVDTYDYVMEYLAAQNVTVKEYDEDRVLYEGCRTCDFFTPDQPQLKHYCSYRWEDTFDAPSSELQKAVDLAKSQGFDCMAHTGVKNVQVRTESLYLVFYKNEPTFRENDLPTDWADYSKRWTPVKAVMALGPEDVFFKMQGENWSPNGEARDLIRAKGLKHTSMSVGDVCMHLKTGITYGVIDVGFRFLPQVSVGGEGTKTYSPAATMTEEEANELNEPSEEEIMSPCETCDGDWGKPEKDCRDCIQNSYRAAMDEDEDEDEDDDRASEEEAHRRHLQSLENKAQHYYDEMARFEPTVEDFLDPDELADELDCSRCPSDSCGRWCPKHTFHGVPQYPYDEETQNALEWEEYIQSEDYAEALGRRREEAGSRHYDNTPEEF